MRILFFVFALIFSNSISVAQDAGMLAMEKGNYDEAIKVWEEMSNDEQGNYPLFINLGTAYAELNQYGKARLYYERALKIKPNGQEARNNIDFIVDKMEDEVIPVEPFFLYRWWQALAFFFSPGIWLVVNVLFLLLALFLCYEYFLGKKEWNTKKHFYWILFAFCGLLISYLLGNSSKYNLIRTDTAVIQNKTELKLGADAMSETVSPLSPGHKVFILDQIGDWYKVSKLDKEQGWIKRESFEII